MGMVQCIGVASQCCYKEVYVDILIIIINFPYSTCIRSFLAAASLLLCSYLKCFFGLYIYSLTAQKADKGSTVRA